MKGVQLVQSKHDFLGIVDDVSTLMMLTSLYHCSEKKPGLKFQNFMCFLKFNIHTTV